MLEKIKTFLLELVSAIQAAKIYSVDHPRFRELVEKAGRSLGPVFEQRKEIVIGIVENEFAWEEEILFDLSQKLGSFILYLRDRGIERMAFEFPLGSEEIGRFVKSLIDPGIKVYADPQEYLIQQGIRNIKAGKIRGPATARLPKKEIPEDYREHYLTSLQTATQSIESVLEEQKISSLDLGFSMLDIMENFVGKYQELLRLVALKEKDIITFAHLLNVSVLSMHLASKMGHSKEEVLNLGNAALFHDIGKIFVSRRILKKKERLDQEESSVMRDHAALGAKILLKYQETLGILAAVIAFEHHLRYDVKGYPRLAFPYRPHRASQIVSVCDVYDALSQKRTYKQDYPPLKIYELMTKEKGRLFDPELVDEFFKAMGVWPVGTIVVLSDERIAVVREANDQDIFRPRVEVIFPEDKKEMIDLAEKKGPLEITAYLNPFAEGKKYIDFL